MKAPNSQLVSTFGYRVMGIYIWQYKLKLIMSINGYHLQTTERQYFPIDFTMYFYVKYKGVAVVQWVGHMSVIREVLCLIHGESQWCQEGHPTSNAPVPH